jgi:hypothetical protein
MLQDKTPHDHKAGNGTSHMCLAWVMEKPEHSGQARNGECKERPLSADIVVGSDYEISWHIDVSWGSADAHIDDIRRPAARGITPIRQQSALLASSRPAAHWSATDQIMRWPGDHSAES